MRTGKKGFPNYRIIAIDKRKKRDGAYKENLGTYNPLTSPATFTLNEARLKYWLEKGAEVSEGMARLMKRQIKKNSA